MERHDTPVVSPSLAFEKGDIDDSQSIKLKELDALEMDHEREIALLKQQNAEHSRRLDSLEATATVMLQHILRLEKLAGDAYSPLVQELLATLPGKQD